MGRVNYERFGFLCPKCNEWQYEYKEKGIFNIMKTGDMYCHDCGSMYRRVVVQENEITYEGSMK